MTTPPYQPNAGKSATAPVQLAIRLGNSEGDAPEAEDIVEHLRLLRIVRTAGGRESDVATFAYDLDKTGERLEDLQTLTGWNRQIEVRALGDTGSEDGEVLFWGDLVASTIQIDPTGEFATVQAVIPPYMFGEPLIGQKVIDPLDDGLNVVDYHVDVVFNPLIDGAVAKNMSQLKDDDEKYYVWIDPESIASITAVDLTQFSNGEFWTIDQALNSLQWAFNADEEFITNFDAVDNEIFADAEELKNVRIRRGQYLPEALDTLLQPLGFNWFVDFAFEDTADPGDGSDHEPVWEVTKTIVVFKRGEGEERQVHFQRPGEAFEATKSNAPFVSVNWDVSDLANSIEAYGSLQEREVTLELFRGWTPSFDHWTADDCDPSDPDSLYYTEIDGHEAHRLWVANEAGDYTGFRDEMPEAPDLREIFDGYVPKRRRLYECLTFTSNTDRRRRPILLEWRNRENESEGNDEIVWEPVPASWGFAVLQDQIGIYFTGDLSNGVAALIGQEEQPMLRVTGTIVGDQRVSQFSTTSGSSPNIRDAKLVLDVSDRFHDRKRQATGDYKSRFINDDVDPPTFDYEADEADDSSALQDFVDELSVVEESASMDASLELHGIHFEYKIGDLITKIDGRNISLNRNSPDSENKRYLQITGTTHDIQAQKTILRVESEEAFA